jgi:archaellum component FlaC
MSTYRKEEIDEAIDSIKKRLKDLGYDYETFSKRYKYIKQKYQDSKDCYEHA